MFAHPILTAAAGLAAAAFAIPAPTGQTSREIPAKRLDTPLGARAVPRIAVRDWTQIPENLIRFEMPPGWTVKRQPTGRIGPLGIYAEFTGFAHPGKNCQAPSVTIDLRPIRAHGFRLAGVAWDRVGAPRNYWLSNPGPHRDVPQNYPAMEQFHAVATPYGKNEVGDRRFPSLCWAALSFTLRIRGPEGVDPLTGREYPPTSPVR